MNDELLLIAQQGQTISLYRKEYAAASAALDAAGDMPIGSPLDIRVARALADIEARVRAEYEPLVKAAEWVNSLALSAKAMPNALSELEFALAAIRAAAAPTTDTDAAAAST